MMNGKLRDYIGKGQPELIRVNIPDAEKHLRAGLQTYIGDDYQWLPEYSGYFDEEHKYHRGIVDWLSDNDGKGLIMYGNCGRGKSVIGEKIIPRLIHFWYSHMTGIGKVVNCYSYRDLNDKLDDIMEKKIIYIDDIGQEEFAKIYGNTIHAFADIVDNAEKKGNLLIVSTNLTADELREKYGERVMSRLKGITQSVKFKGEDLR